MPVTLPARFDAQSQCREALYVPLVIYLAKPTKKCVPLSCRINRLLASLSNEQSEEIAPQALCVSSRIALADARHACKVSLDEALGGQRPDDQSEEEDESTRSPEAVDQAQIVITV